MHKYFDQFQWISGNVYLLSITFFQNKIRVWATDCPTISYLSVIMHVDPLESLCTKWVVKGEKSNSNYYLTARAYGREMHNLQEQSSDIFSTI